MSTMTPSLTDKLRAALAYDCAIEKPLREKYRIVECDGPCDSYGVCPNCIEANEMLVGAQEENARLAPLHEAMIEACAKASDIRLRCFNTGNYGALKLSPGQCRCGACELNIALAKLHSALGGESE